MVESDLNYPSFSLAVEDLYGVNGFFTRKVTNVGSPNSTYHAEVYTPEAIRVKVEQQFFHSPQLGKRNLLQ